MSGPQLAMPMQQFATRDLPITSLVSGETSICGSQTCRPIDITGAQMLDLYHPSLLMTSPVMPNVGLLNANSCLPATGAGLHNPSHHSVTLASTIPAGLHLSLARQQSYDARALRLERKTWHGGSDRLRCAVRKTHFHTFLRFNINE